MAPTNLIDNTKDTIPLEEVYLFLFITDDGTSSKIQGVNMEELDLKEIMHLFWQKKIQIMIILIISVIAGTVYTLNCVTPLYRSSTTLILGRINAFDESQKVIKDNGQITQSELSINASLVSTYSQLIKSESLIQEVKNNLSTDISEEDLRKSITVKRVDDTELIEIMVTNINPEVASEVANEIAKVFGSKVEEIYKISNVYIIDRACPSSTPYNINHIKDVMIFAFAGMVLAVIYIVIYNLLDTTVKSSNDIEKITNVKNLISIPLSKDDKKELITYEDSKSVISEAFRTLRTNVQFSSINDKKTKTYLVTSCFQSEGKSYISSNLAITFAQAGKKVILIDSDMRRGRQSKIFNFPNEIGLSNYISNIDPNGMEINYDITRYIKETGITNLNIITSGNVPPNPSELLASPKVPELIRELKSFYDVIIFDGAPVLPITDSLILTRLLDSTILVARYNQTRKDDIAKAKSDLENVGGKIIGTCLNAVTTNSSSGDLNYYYYYGEKEESSFKDNVKHKFNTLGRAIKKLRKLPKINRSNSKKIRIIEKNKNVRPVVREAKRIVFEEPEEVKENVEEVNYNIKGQVEFDDIQENKVELDNENIKNNYLEELKRQREIRREKVNRDVESKFKEDKHKAELKAQEEARLEEEKRQEELRMREEARLEEERRQEELRKQEEARLEEERRQEKLRKQEEARLEEERRQEELRKQEEARLEEERRQEELRKQEEARLEEERRQEELRKQEEARLEEERRQEELRKKEEARLAELKRKEEEKKKKEEEKQRKREERKEKIQNKIDSAKNRVNEIKENIEKNKEEKKIRKAEKRIRQMEEQAKQANEKLQKAEEERDKIFGKRMFDLDDEDVEETNKKDEEKV